VTDLSIDDLLRSSRAHPERHVDPERVDRYTAVLDALPPVTVFETPGGLLLADGYHRLAAARRLGRKTIAATVIQGNDSDALRFATELAIRERGLSEEDVSRAIQRHATGTSSRE
jgi:hypothetical protein